MLPACSGPPISPYRSACATPAQILPTPDEGYSTLNNLQASTRPTLPSLPPKRSELLPSGGIRIIRPHADGIRRTRGTEHHEQPCRVRRFLQFRGPHLHVAVRQRLSLEEHPAAVPADVRGRRPVRAGRRGHWCLYRHGDVNRVIYDL